MKVLAILGSGHQALAHMQVLLNQHPTITDIKVWNHRKSGAIKMAEEASGWLKEGQKIEVFENVENCVTEADLVVTATFAPRPVLKSGLKSIYNRTQCGNFRIFLPFRFYVKSISRILESLCKSTILTNSEALKFDLYIFLHSHLRN